MPDCCVRVHNLTRRGGSQYVRASHIYRPGVDGPAVGRSKVCPKPAAPQPLLVAPHRWHGALRSRYATLPSIPDLFLGGHARVYVFTACCTLRGRAHHHAWWNVMRVTASLRFDGAFSADGGAGSDEAGVSVTTLCERLSRSGICGVVAMRVPFNFAVDDWAARMVSACPLPCCDCHGASH